MRTNRRKLLFLNKIPSEYIKLRYVSTERKYGIHPKYDVPFILTDVIATIDTRIEMTLLLYRHHIESDGYIWGYNIAGGYSPGNDADFKISTTSFKVPGKFDNDYNNFTISTNDIVKVDYPVPYNKVCKIYVDVSSNFLKVDFGDGVIKSAMSDKKPVKVNNKKISFMTLTPFIPPFGNLYGAKIYHGNVLKCNLVPVKRKSDGVIGMYDLVGKKLYTSPNGMAFTGR